MMNTRRSFTTLLLAVACALTGFADPSFANSARPPTGFAGAPPSGASCATCHFSSGTGSVSLGFSGGASYTAGELYTLMVQVEDPGQLRWGFSMVARDADNNTVDVGTWSVVPGSTDTEVNPGNSHYVNHKSAPFDSDSDGKHTFTVQWTAPASGVGDIRFYVAANAANGNSASGNGDHVYTTTLTVSEPSENLPPSITTAGGTVAVTRGEPAAIDGISISDPDAATGELTVDLSVQHGTLTIDDSVPGGVAAGKIDSNASSHVTLNGTLDQLNATLSAVAGLSYLGNPGYTGAELLAIEVNDNGNTGGGGARTASAQIDLSVYPPPRLTDLHFLPGGAFAFTLNGIPGGSYSVQFYDEISGWSPLEEVTLVGASLEITDAGASEKPSRIYRAVESEN